MCGRWNLPIFLLRDGLLTLMYSASFIALLRFWSSLPTILKFSMVTWWLVMLLWSNIGEHGVQVYFKGGHTIKSLLMNPKDKDPILKKSGIIYRYKCGRVDCDEEFGERFKEHQKAPSPIFDHSNITGHQVTIENFNIVGREDQNLSRAIKEALYIRVNNPSLNRNIGKFHLPHIWDWGSV